MPRKPKCSCGTCSKLQYLLEMAAKQIQKMPEQDKTKFRQEIRRQFGIWQEWVN